LIELKVFYWFIKAIFCGLFQMGGRNLRIAGKELISKPTFRQPDAAFRDKLIGIKLLKRSWSNLSIKPEEPEEPIEILVFDGSTKSFDIRLNYLVWVKKYKPEKVFGLGRDNASNFAKGFWSRILLVPIAFLVLPFTILSENRVQWALIFSEFTEVCGLINFVTLKQIKTIHFFSPGEKDSNLIYLILKKHHCKVIKHPSPGALIAYNKYLMADILAVSSKYQEEEFEVELKKTISVSEIEKWPPENAFSYHHLYNNQSEEFKYKYGYYSHGGWLRLKNNSSKALFAQPEEEEDCLSILSEFIKQNSDTLMIYLHPKEKVQIDIAQEYYAKIFKGINLSFYKETNPSSFDFASVEIGIGAYSTVLFERETYGFKTIYWKEKNGKFPLMRTSAFKHSFNTISELKELVC